jgi:hypothetical protein
VVPEQRAGALNGDGRLEQIGHSTPLLVSYGSGDHDDPHICAVMIAGGGAA